MTGVLINRRAATLPDDPEALLVDVLRDRLRLTGTKLVHCFPGSTHITPLH